MTGPTADRTAEPTRRTRPPTVDAMPPRSVLAPLAALLTLAFGTATATGAAAAVPNPVPAGTPLPTSTSSVTVSLDGRSFPARVVQPTGTAPAAYPVVAFGHGFLQPSSRYAGTLTSIASRGYIVIAPDSETGFAPNHGRLADDLWRSLRWASDRARYPNADPDNLAVMGHSMGGGAALVAADRYDAPGQIDTVATLAAAETNPSATAASLGIAGPALYVVGSQDTIVRPATTEAMYRSKPSPATLATIVGGYHCGFLDSSPLFGLGCDSGSRSRSQQLAATRTLLGDWLDRQFRGVAPSTLPTWVTVAAK